MKKQNVIAVIGCGNIANGAHFPALSAIKNVRIKYAVDLIKDRAENAREKYGCEQAIVDYKIALADPEVESVYVLTPPQLCAVHRYHGRIECGQACFLRKARYGQL